MRSRLARPNVWSSAGMERLSPTTKYSSGASVTGALFHVLGNLMYGSGRTWSLMSALPLLKATDSPGRPMTRFNSMTCRPA